MINQEDEGVTYSGIIQMNAIIFFIIIVCDVTNIILYGQINN